MESALSEERRVDVWEGLSEAFVDNVVDYAALRRGGGRSSARRVEGDLFHRGGSALRCKSAGPGPADLDRF